jgi:hypothetical protein
VSKPTRKVTPSGMYDPVATRQRYAEWTARQGGGAQSRVQTPQAAAVATPLANMNPKSEAATTPPVSDGPKMDFDPEVGF